MSLGMSTSTGPGRPVVAMWNAWRMASGMSSARVTSSLCLVTPRVMPMMSHSWKASVPIAADGTWPVMHDHRHRVHVGVGERRDDVGRAGAGGHHGHARAGRWRGRSPRPCGRRPARGARGRGGSGCRGSGRTPGRIAPPGRPKITSTPSSSRERISASPPLVFMSGFLWVAWVSAEKQNDLPQGRSRAHDAGWSDPVVSLRRVRGARAAVRIPDSLPCRCPRCQPPGYGPCA